MSGIPFRVNSIAMRLEILPRFVLADLLDKAKRCWRYIRMRSVSRARPRRRASSRPVDRASRPEPVTDSRFHDGQLLLDRRPPAARRGKSRHFLQHQLTLDRLPDRRGIGRRSRLDEPEFHERLHIGLRDRFRADPRQHAVQKLLR